MERASAVGFIDVDVGRSSWSSDHLYVTLLPTATLMSPVDSKQGTGRQNVSMFKKVDFRVTCTQPFNKQSQFGLSFLRIRTMEDEAEYSSVQHEDTAAENLTTLKETRQVDLLSWGSTSLEPKTTSRGFNSNERKTVPLHEPILHDEPAEETVEEEDKDCRRAGVTYC
ncbi:DNA repair protein XRCC1-like [Sinocyclocheilus grahami]|uniref:DNA repair protein XRCC1-like n=1 Tax=Sinocyclocheilus grahami TaxID=75366 RepID=UPI0007AC76FF|nr:PREDICTED: DNA repair protein XRCC1-like [Sinocyclocheilus grahami]